MHDEGGYPDGVKFDDRAPWNQCVLTPKEVEVDIILTMSVRKKILVDDYTREEEHDEDGGHFIYDYSDCNLERQAMEQIRIPTEMYEFKDWTIDDFEVFLT